MNTIYNQSFETGLDTTHLDELESLRKTTHTEVMGSEVVQTNEGLSIVSSIKILRGVLRVLGNFIGGSFIYNLTVNVLGFPAIVATVLVIIIWISLILIIIALVMKVNP
jgi:hypothetical protein